MINRARLSAALLTALPAKRVKANASDFEVSGDEARARSAGVQAQTREHGHTVTKCFIIRNWGRFSHLPRSSHSAQMSSHIDIFDFVVIP
jgi:hypothetical protein